nr:Chain B, Protein AMBP [Homo sapiens]
QEEEGSGGPQGG